MTGSVQVVADDQRVTTPDKVQQLAGKQLVHDTVGAFAAERAADHKQVVQQPDGTKLVTLRAGATAGKVELFEMLRERAPPARRPGAVALHRGNEIHTVTFPTGTDQGEPLVPACENTPTDDPFVPPVAGPPCGDPSKFELHVFPQPFGAYDDHRSDDVRLIGSDRRSWWSVALDDGVFTFPNSGTFTLHVPHPRSHDRHHSGRAARPARPARRLSSVAAMRRSITRHSWRVIDRPLITDGTIIIQRSIGPGAQGWLPDAINRARNSWSTTSHRWPRISTLHPDSATGST